MQTQRENFSNQQAFVLAGMTKTLEEALQEDVFVISLRHLEPRKKGSSQQQEHLFAAVFTGTDQKMMVSLDRHAKRGKIRFPEENFPQSSNSPFARVGFCVTLQKILARKYFSVPLTYYLKC
jgi:hypothetical protein